LNAAARSEARNDFRAPRPGRTKVFAISPKFQQFFVSVLIRAR
jgi:hypothetical protein